MPAQSAKPLTAAQRRIQLELALAGDPGQRLAIQRISHGDPHRYLGPHATTIGKKKGTVIRTHQPGVDQVEVLAGKKVVAAEEVAPGLFAAWLPGRSAKLDYRLRCYTDEATWEQDDAYRFAPTLADDDLYLFAEGSLRHLWNALGAIETEAAGVSGFAFVVWAPNAQRVSVVGDWNG
ncbi:MAG: hypothetical protein AAGE94_21200, partial [Acidobacteriota bacterium]